MADLLMGVIPIGIFASSFVNFSGSVFFWISRKVFHQRERSRLSMNTIKYSSSEVQINFVLFIGSLLKGNTSEHLL